MEPPVDICPTAHASSSSDPIVSSSDPMDNPFVAEPRQVSRRMNLTDDLAFMHVARQYSIQARSEEDRSGVALHATSTQYGERRPQSGRLLCCRPVAARQQGGRLLSPLRSEPRLLVLTECAHLFSHSLRPSLAASSLRALWLRTGRTVSASPRT